MADLTLAAARKRLLKLVDDADWARFNEDDAAIGDLSTVASIPELDQPLAVGQEEAWMHAVQSNRALFCVEGSATSSSAGVVDLTTLKPVMPLEALNEYESSSGARWKIAPVNMLQAPASALVAKTLRVLYVPRVALPTAAATAFVWGHANVTMKAQLERCMLHCAAAELLITEGVPNPVLEKRRDELKAALASALSGGEWAVIDFDELGEGAALESGYGYVQTAPDTLQLVWR